MVLRARLTHQKYAKKPVDFRRSLIMEKKNLNALYIAHADTRQQSNESRNNRNGDDTVCTTLSRWGTTVVHLFLFVEQISCYSIEIPLIFDENNVPGIIYR